MQLGITVGFVNNNLKPTSNTLDDKYCALTSDSKTSVNNLVTKASNSGDITFKNTGLYIG